MRSLALVSLVVAALAVSSAAAAPPAADLYTPFDKILDTYVRDGDVYYRALLIERRNFDRFATALDVAPATLASWSKPEQLAFWINAYNAMVLQTVIDHYPIKAVSKDYPPKSIRQIPGSFEKLTHRVAGESLTLDAIETTKIVPFGDARALLALGRGALGSGRLKSEPYRAATLDAQLDLSVKEFVVRVNSFKVDDDANVVLVSPLFGWRQEAFVRSFGALGARWVDRSPIEQAVLGLAAPHLFNRERTFLLQNAFQFKYGAFDWRLNDLTGGSPE